MTDLKIKNLESQVENLKAHIKKHDIPPCPPSCEYRFESCGFEPIAMFAGIFIAILLVIFIETVASNV